MTLVENYETSLREWKLIVKRYENGLLRTKSGVMAVYVVSHRIFKRHKYEVMKKCVLVFREGENGDCLVSFTHMICHYVVNQKRIWSDVRMFCLAMQKKMSD